MATLAREINPITIEEELKQSYLDYAMSVIVGRALPDVRDGLKPVHRRVLFAMNGLNNDWNKAHKKSARIVGDVIGKYHPHGDSAVYDTIVRMAQPFSLRYMLVDGQGNFGSVDGDAPAAMRYTEIRMSKLAHQLLADIDKETVDFSPNYDGSESEPVVLPTQIPNLLINGSSGIAVGMATNIPPHNLTEVINALVALLDNGDITIDDLIQHIPGPDFPTAGIINGRAGIVQAYKTGRGRVIMRARAEIETDEKSGRSQIIVHELPYQVNKARLLEKIGLLVKEKRLEGIVGLRDESDKDGMRMVIEVRRGDQPEIVLNNLYIHTQMQSTFGINMVALDHGQPKTFDLKQVLEAFLQHRREVVTRRTIFELKKARKRAHVLEGLAVALANIDEVIALVKAAKTPQDAKAALLDKAWQPGLVAALLAQEGAKLTRPAELLPEYGLQDAGYRLSPEQAQAILDLRLHRLTGLEVEKINNEYNEIILLIQELMEILSNPERLSAVIKEEMVAIRDQFGDERRTEIRDSEEDLTSEDLIEQEECVVTVSHQGYIKSQSLSDYAAQRRGGKGKSATKLKDEDYVKSMLIANTHDYILCFSTFGKVYWLKTYQVPRASRQSKGRPVINILPLASEEEISTILPVKDFDVDGYIFMATKLGKVKKVALTEFNRPRASGKIAIELQENDQLIGTALTDGQQDIMLLSSAGKAIRFKEDDVRPMGRTAAGVRGIKLAGEQAVIAVIIPDANKTLLTATQNGYGQRTRLDDYSVIGRGGQGVIAIKVSERNGDVIGAVQVADDDETLLISSHGTMVRTRADEISVLGRNTQGVRLVRVVEGEQLVAIEAIDSHLIVDNGADESVDDEQSQD